MQPDKMEVIRTNAYLTHAMAASSKDVVEVRVCTAKWEIQTFMHLKQLLMAFLATQKARRSYWPAHLYHSVWEELGRWGRRQRHFTGPPPLQIE